MHTLPPLPFQYFDGLYILNLKEGKHMQRVKEELQDIAKQLTETAALLPDPSHHEALIVLASRIRNAGTLMPCDTRTADAKKAALEAYREFTALVNEGVFA